MLIQFGFNDANVPFWTTLPRVSLREYRRNLREFHRAALAAKSQCIVNHPIGAYKRLQGNGQDYKATFAPYSQAVQEIAAELGAPSIDLPQIIQERGISLANLLGEDGFHLSRTGNHLYADMIFTALIPLLIPLLAIERTPLSYLVPAFKKNKLEAFLQASPLNNARKEYRGDTRRCRRNPVR